MNQKLWITIPAASIATVLGLTSFAHAQPTKTVDIGSEALPQTEISDKLQFDELQPAASNSSSVTLEKKYRKMPRYKNSSGGMASWYGAGGYTAAHRNLPFGTRVRVTNLNNNRSVVVRINDRGPFTGGRVIDVSAAAARSLGLFSSGVAPVSLQILGR